MADGVVPFYSSSPPPFDDDKDFKFDDDEYFPEVISSEFVETPIQPQEMDTDEKPVKDISVTSEKNADDDHEDDFDDFVDYQETITIFNDKIPETTYQDNFIKVCESDMDDLVTNPNMESEQTKIAIDISENSVIQDATCMNAESDTEFYPCDTGLATKLDSNKIDVHDEAENVNSFLNESEKPAVEIGNGEISLAPVEDECWAQFEAFPEKPPIEKQTLTVSESDDDDDFGGFEEANNVPGDHVPIADSSNECKQALFQTFHLVSDDGESMATSLTDVINSCQEENTQHKQKNIWMDLRSVERTPALSMQWKTSHLFKSFLKILKVSSQMKTSSRFSSSNVPVFATNLGLLEPKRLIDSESSEYKEETFFDIPKVEFDWASSVLVDPLGVGNISRLDLDFFTDDMFTTCVSQASKKEKELLDSLEPTRSDPHKSLTLDNLMATNNVTIIKSSHDSKVSPRVKVVLDRMPDLSFMRAKVLMFPLIEEFVTN